MMTDIPTTERLAKALEELADPRLAEIITRARRGIYDDFRSSLPRPKTTLVMELRALGQHDFADRVSSGEFDNTFIEALDWEDSPEGRQAMAEAFRQSIQSQQKGKRKRDYYPTP